MHAGGDGPARPGGGAALPVTRQTRNCTGACDLGSGGRAEVRFDGVLERLV